MSCESQKHEQNVCQTTNVSHSGTETNVTIRRKNLSRVRMADLGLIMRNLFGRSRHHMRGGAFNWSLQNFSEDLDALSLLTRVLLQWCTYTYKVKPLVRDGGKGTPFFSSYFPILSVSKNVCQCVQKMGTAFHFFEELPNPCH